MLGPTFRGGCNRDTFCQKCLNFEAICCVLMRDISMLLWHRLLGTFAKLRRVTISIVMSVFPCVRMEQLGSHWTDFDETDI